MGPDTIPVTKEATTQCGKQLVWWTKCLELGEHRGRTLSLNWRHLAQSWELKVEVRVGEEGEGGKWEEVVAQDQENTGAKAHLSQSLGTSMQPLHRGGEWQVIVHKGSNPQ